LVIVQYVAMRKLVIANNELIYDTRKTLKFRKDPSCAWADKDDFFKDICDKIDELPGKARAHLHIYRGYDQGEREPNRSLQQTIMRALRDGRIAEFHRVVVVTSEAFITTAVEWMLPFAIAPELRDKCYFYVAFRRKFNLGSYVALAKNKCFIAMPRLEPNRRLAPSTTQSGIFAEDEKIAEIICHYIENLRDEASNPNSIHVVDCPLEDHNWERIQRPILEKRITEAFLKFDHQSTIGTETPFSAKQTPPTGWGARLSLPFLRFLRFLHLRS
jgi:hypothetical protein